MSPSEQADAVLLLRRWINALTDRERESVEAETRAFLVHLPTEAARKRSLLERLGWTPAARPLPPHASNPVCARCGRSMSYHEGVGLCPDTDGTFRGAPLMATHRLKSWPVNFRAVVTGRKRFEIRRDDRPFNAGDVVELHEWRPDSLETAEDGIRAGYTGRVATYRIGYVSRANGTPPGWCGFELISPEDWARVEVAMIGANG